MKFPSSAAAAATGTAQACLHPDAHDRVTRSTDPALTRPLTAPTRLLHEGGLP